MWTETQVVSEGGLRSSSVRHSLPMAAWAPSHTCVPPNRHLSLPPTPCTATHTDTLKQEFSCKSLNTDKQSL